MTDQILIIIVLKTKDAISFTTDFCRKIMQILVFDKNGWKIFQLSDQQKYMWYLQQKYVIFLSNINKNKSKFYIDR